MKSRDPRPLDDGDGRGRKLAASVDLVKASRSGPFSSPVQDEPGHDRGSLGGASLEEQMRRVEQFHAQVWPRCQERLSRSRADEKIALAREVKNRGRERCKFARHVDGGDGLQASAHHVGVDRGDRGVRLPDESVVVVPAEERAPQDDVGHRQADELLDRAAPARERSYRENKLPFALLAQRLPLRVLRGAGEGATALLLGVAGFLQMPEPDGFGADGRETRAYLRTCWEQWWPHRGAMERLVLPAGAWKLGGLRPANHPQRRLAAMAQLARAWPRLRALIDGDGGDFAKDAAKFLTGLKDDFWDWHYTLAAPRAGRPVALIGSARATEMLANVLFPRAIAARPERWTEYERLPAAQSNRRIETAAARLFDGGGAAGEDQPLRAVKTAVQQQGLLQIYEDFCLQDDSDCERCTFPERVRRFEFKAY